MILVSTFPYSDWILRDTEHLSVFSPNTGKFGTEKIRTRALFTQCQWAIKTTITNICLVALLRIFVRKLFCKLLSTYLWQSLFLVKFHAFSIFFWALLDGWLWRMKIILCETSSFRHSKNIQVAAWIYKSLLNNLSMELYQKWKLQLLLLGNKEHKAMFPVVSQSGPRFGLACLSFFFFFVPDRVCKWNCTPEKLGRWIQFGHTCKWIF